ncbi:MAG: HDOD domain-containing protein [candidate division Zixibacteria bacterium]|jgi:putative nucleotidyltransferase with HDIG domain|nr:HDOD domain-containing protein [candidate division Zixibacteria bacterium]
MVESMLPNKLSEAQLVDLPSPPGIIQKLHSCMAEEEVSSNELARVIETDQAFTARILKLVNSPFYGFTRDIASVQEAVTMIGFHAVHQLLLATSLLSEFRTKNSAINIDDFWRHSFGVGVIARRILNTVDRDTKQAAFVSGVLHDIGRLVYMKIMPDTFVTFYTELSMVTDLEAEVKFFGIDHQETGRALAQKWNFPESVTTVIANHHNPDAVENHGLLVSAVNIADILCHALQIGDSGNYYVSEFNLGAWKRIGLIPEDLEGILKKALDEIDESEKVVAQLR